MNIRVSKGAVMAEYLLVSVLLMLVIWYAIVGGSGDWLDPDKPENHAETAESACNVSKTIFWWAWLRKNRPLPPAAAPHHRAPVYGKPSRPGGLQTTVIQAAQRAAAAASGRRFKPPKSMGKLPRESLWV